MALSPLHETLSHVYRATNARKINEIVNHPKVLPFVQGGTTPPLDLTPAVGNPNNVLLMGEFGGVFFVPHWAGFYEAHSQCLPEGRGQWMADFARAAVYWMFTRTDCYEIQTRCPTLASRALARHLGWSKEFTNPTGWTIGDRVVPADIYAVRLFDWWKTAPGLAERGEWFHKRLNEEYTRLTGAAPKHGADDGSHDRMTGLVTEMILNGQPNKAVLVYRRWAQLADHPPIRVMQYDPLTIDIHGAILIVQGDDDFFVASVLPPETMH